MSSGRKNQGRKKIEMKRITNDNNMQVTFSKRRSGLFKKASELNTLCGADVFIVIFSPGNKVFSFGHPNVYTVIDRYLSQLPSQNNGMQIIDAQHNAKMCDLNSQLTRINDELDIEKRRRDDLSHMNNLTENHYWWACPFDGMNFSQLGLLKNSLDELKKRIPEHANRFVNQGAPIQTMSFSNMYVHHQPSPQQGQMFSEQHFQPNPYQHQMFPDLPFQPNPQQSQIFLEQPFQDPMLQHNSFNVNNMGEGGYGPPRFF